LPVKKYRSVEDMEDRSWVQPGTPEHRAAVRRVLEVASLFGVQRCAPRGVFKYASIEEAGAQREAWERLSAKKPVGQP
jgi:hypothetical protein